MIKGSVKAPIEYQLLSLATTWLLCQLYLVGGSCRGWSGQKPELVFTQIGQLDVSAEMRLIWRQEGIMEKTVWVSDKFRHDWDRFIEFVQHQANRLGFGYPQYEAKNHGPSSEQRYFKRLKDEVKAYERNGNREHLLNIANYAWLESRAPQNPKFHWNSEADSVTRLTKKKRAIWDL